MLLFASASEFTAVAVAFTETLVLSFDDFCAALEMV